MIEGGQAQMVAVVRRDFVPKMEGEND